VLDGVPAPPKWMDIPPIFGPCLLWPNAWMDQDATLYGGRHETLKIFELLKLGVTLFSRKYS